MPDQSQIVAREILQVIPLVMRALSSQMRHSGSLQVPAHLGLLGMLLKKPRSLGELARAHGVAASTMSRTVNTLCQRGWVCRGKAQYDRRVVLIEITSAGQVVLDQVRREAEERLAELLASLSNEESEALFEGLAVLRSAFARTGANSVE